MAFLNEKEMLLVKKYQLLCVQNGHHVLLIKEAVLMAFLKETEMLLAIHTSVNAVPFQAQIYTRFRMPCIQSDAMV